MMRLNSLFYRLITDNVGRLLRKLGRARQEFPNCIPGKTGIIPSSHIYHTKKQPLIIGHRGNPTAYQENTYDGFASLLDKKHVDGFELDVYLTIDNKLVTIFDSNLQVSYIETDGVELEFYPFVYF